MIGGNNNRKMNPNNSFEIPRLQLHVRPPLNDGRCLARSAPPKNREAGLAGTADISFPSHHRGGIPPSRCAPWKEFQPPTRLPYSPAARNAGPVWPDPQSAQHGLFLTRGAGPCWIFLSHLVSHLQSGHCSSSLVGFGKDGE